MSSGPMCRGHALNPSRRWPMRPGRPAIFSSSQRSSNSAHMDVISLSIAELREQLTARAVSPVEVVTALEQRIAAVDPIVGGYLTRDFDRARRDAEAADLALPLGGVPIAIKDLINVQGEPCTCASKILQGYTAPYDATVIKKL